MAQSADVPTVLPKRPGKIIAVHVAYESRAKERGRRPKAPTYFLKAPSSVTGTGADLVRPKGTRLMAFEAEIALVIGKPAYRVPLAEAWDHVAFVTAANDLGIYDYRPQDKGSNIRSKSRDGYTPLGPRLIDAREVSPDKLRVRAWLNGELVQDDTTAVEALIFPLPQFVADLSQHFTSRRGGRDPYRNPDGLHGDHPRGHARNRGGCPGARAELGHIDQLRGRRRGRL